ncbi:large conductance mechanosensitive channel protein MscL [Microbacterium sp. EYE_5]|uniref:large conductance mechanosensitive channel protein MscL n=1 Tax=unclassified Microbacterium TaxID=2609290 RepID=UPI0020036DDE|nr:MULTISPECIES: large conductance mechanosensitive channel protein MscL [unclassified Microbacterium]MCK6081227.1 large conductance mechanosensitive channel protein MscL [Microbacterium sp. EYE_382]MCK6086497.1 large conductance mechanosensitive channel protein MscL [Microbacterium sp. EYE_384]MCK6124005.1 large conductance mechanosensitive channel protein MscL [Microbacterium sp. EYE_80]MCK6126914.1 large conductance mechanosensitive channel protein MscL [Microbacterium sp. EYE_79]MCK6142182
MIQGFKDFIMRGNVIDLAVAVVIGGAFTAIVTAIVDSLITPLIGLFYIPNENGESGPTLTGIYGQEVTFPLSGLLTAIISFFAVALVVYFAFVMPMNKWKERQAARAGVAEEPEAKLPTEAELLVQIRDLLESQRPTNTPSPTTPPSPSI